LRDDPATASAANVSVAPQLALLPGGDVAEDARGEQQSEEETKPFIIPDATGRSHTSL